jgi:hypothetical protein
LWMAAGRLLYLYPVSQWWGWPRACHGWKAGGLPHDGDSAPSAELE